MRYEDARRLRGVESVWLRLKLWFRPLDTQTQAMRDLRHLPDHIRQDIGLPEPARYMDWRALNEKGRF